MGSLDQLYDAIDADDLSQAKSLLAAQPELVDSVEETPPPIHWAIFQDRLQMIELLLDRGASLELQDQDRNATPLDYAIMYGRREIIPTLVSRGAELEGRLQTALRAASGQFKKFDDLPKPEEYEETVELLRELGLDD